MFLSLSSPPSVLWTSFQYHPLGLELSLGPTSGGTYFKPCIFRRSTAISCFLGSLSPHIPLCPPLSTARDAVTAGYTLREGLSHTLACCVHVFVGQSCFFRQDTEGKGREMVTPGGSGCSCLDEVSPLPLSSLRAHSCGQHCRWGSARAQERAQALLSCC